MGQGLLKRGENIKNRAINGFKGKEVWMGTLKNKDQSGEHYGDEQTRWGRGAGNEGNHG